MCLFFYFILTVFDGEIFELICAEQLSRFITFSNEKECTIKYTFSILSRIPQNKFVILLQITS